MCFGCFVVSDQSRFLFEHVPPGEVQVCRLVHKGLVVGRAPNLPPPACAFGRKSAAYGSVKLGQSAARAATADLIITGDQDLLILRSFVGIPIVDATEAVERLGLE